MGRKIIIVCYIIFSEKNLFMFPIIHNPPSVIKSVFIVCGINKNNFSRILGVVGKGVGLPVEGYGGRVAVGEVGLLINWGGESDIVAAFFKFQVHCHATA